jgi:hypothetical protein
MSENNGALCQYCDLDGNYDYTQEPAYTESILAPVWHMFKTALETIKDILYDFFLWAFCGLFEGLLFVASFIEFPTIINSLQGVIAGLSPSIAYMLSMSGFPQALNVIGGGLTFYVLRKFATLGNW